MKVLHVYRTYYPDTQGGLEEVIRQICRNTKDLGVESRVFAITSAPEGSGMVKTEEALVYRAKQTFEVASCNVSLAAFSMFKELAHWADVIHYHFPWPFADVLHLTSTIRKPTVLTYHSDIVRQRMLGKLYQPLMYRFLDSVDRIVCTSPNYFATSDVLTRYERKVSVIPIGISRDSYPNAEPATLANVRAAYGEGFFLFVGVLRYYKGLHILLDAIEHAPYQVVIAGSGPTELELKQQVRDKGLKNVKFSGYVGDSVKVALFQLSGGIVFPSYLRSEAFGVTLLEGAMFGKPLISTEVGSGTSHVNVSGRTGLVVSPGSATSLREAMDQLKNYPQRAQQMGKNAEARFEKLFTGKLMGERYRNVYREIGGLAQDSSSNLTSLDTRSNDANRH